MVDQHTEEAASSEPSDQPPHIDHGIPLDQRTQAERDAITREQGPKVAPKSGSSPGQRNSPALLKRDHRGQIAGRKELTDKEAALADMLAAGVPSGLAGRLAGYADPAASASRAKRTPAVAGRILELQRLRLGRTGAQAIRVIEDILTDAIPAPASVRLDAAKYVLRVNGVELQADKASNTKDLRAMSMDELLAIAATFKGRTDPVRPGDDAQAVDIIEQSTT
jgi:hypothetical protein